MGARERWSDDDGFSLLELVVVTIILGILAAIALALFFAQREKAQRSSAVSSVRNTSTMAETIRFDGAAYTDDPDVYADEGGGGFTFVNGASTGPGVVSVETFDDEGDATPLPPPDENARGPIVVIAAQGGGRCYWIRHAVDAAPVRDYFEMDDGDGCHAAGSVPGGGPSLSEAEGDGW